MPSRAIGALRDKTKGDFPDPMKRLAPRALAGVALAVCMATAASAAEPPLQPGEAFATRFSGARLTMNEEGAPDSVINEGGVVGSILDIRDPGFAPQGAHWADEPQRAAVTAAEVGQVFGIAIDDVDPASIFLTATAAFGLHRTADGSDWMPGMWGADGGPGTVWRLDPDNDYRPEAFAQITLDGRENTGASLGNIAYDRWNKQLFVSDLETGMIFRLDAASGDILDHFDHGVDGRARFLDAATGQERSLELVAFAPGMAAALDTCDTDFSSSPECWNVADFRRRVWGLGLYRDEDRRTVRLYYAIWASDPLGAEGWTDSGVERRNSLWSVALNADGGFDIDDVRREFILPDFDRDGIQNGAAVTDLAFSRDGTVVLAERGGMRNLGLDGDRPFATPQIARVLQYKRREGAWQFLARFDVGFYDRQHDGSPYIRANAAGGVDFGFAYTADGRLDTNAPDAVVWMSGDALCSPDGPCTAAQGDDEAAGDDTQVHGLQGTPRRFDAELVPEAALADYPDTGMPYAPDGPAHSYLIDLDVNVDASGRGNLQSGRDDTTMIGDVEVFRHMDIIAPQPPQQPQPQVSAVEPLPQVVVPEPPGGVVEELPAPPPPPAPPYASAPGQDARDDVEVDVDIDVDVDLDDEDEDPQLAEFHQRFDSGWHDRRVSAPVHDSNVSHNRIGSQRRGQASSQAGNDPYEYYDEDAEEALAGHVEPWSHYRPGSHARRASYRHFRRSPWRPWHSRWRSSFD